MALSSAPEALNPFRGTGLLVGYHPSEKYCRTSSADAAAMGAAIEVPLMKAS